MHCFAKEKWDKLFLSGPTLKLSGNFKLIRIEWYMAITVRQKMRQVNRLVDVFSQGNNNYLT